MSNKLYEEQKAVVVLPPQTLSGASVKYNNTSLGDTGAWSLTNLGGYLDAAKYGKAQIHVALGSVTGPGTGTVSAVVGPAGAYATGMSGVTGVNSSSVSFTTADDNTLKVIEIDLEKVPQPQLWVKASNPTDLVSLVSVTVVLGKPDKLPVASSADAEFSG